MGSRLFAYLWFCKISLYVPVHVSPQPGLRNLLDTFHELGWISVVYVLLMHDLWSYHLGLLLACFYCWIVYGASMQAFYFHVLLLRCLWSFLSRFTLLYLKLLLCLWPLYPRILLAMFYWYIICGPSIPAFCCPCSVAALSVLSVAIMSWLSCRNFLTQRCLWSYYPECLLSMFYRGIVFDRPIYLGCYPHSVVALSQTRLSGLSVYL